MRNSVTFFSLLKAILLFITLQFFLAPFVFYPFYSIKQMESPLISGWIGAFGIVISFIGILIFFYCQPTPCLKDIWYLSKEKENVWYKDVLFGVLTCVMFYPFIMIVEASLSALMTHYGIDVQKDQVAVKQIKEVLSDLPLLIILGVGICILVPVVEELLFRGFLQQWLKNYLSITNSILVTSLFFAAVHMSSDQGWANIPLIISLYLLSCLLGYVRETRGSLWASIGLHGFFNLISVSLIIALEI